MNINRGRVGFTLIEMVVALSLSAIMLVVLNGVMQRCFTEMRATQSDQLLHETSILVEQLRRDFTNARRLRVGNNRLELFGFLHRDPRSLVSTHLPARVVYEIRKSGQKSLLVRIQFAQANETAIETSIEPAWEDAGSLVLMSDQIGAISRIETTPMNDSSANAAMSQSRIPSPLRLTLLNGKGNVVIEEVFLRPREG